MASDRRRYVLLVVVGLAAVANPVWLFPNEGETRYTYERVEIAVESGTLAYGHDQFDRFHDFRNGLEAVDCQWSDGPGRDCALDRYLREHGPVTVDGEYRAAEPRFTRLGDAYYRRVHRQNESAGAGRMTYDVRRVDPRTVLNASAVTVTGLDADDVEGFSLDGRVAVTGETVRTTRRLDAEDLGQVYRDGDTYYTVVATGEQTLDRPLVDPLRDLLPLAGIPLALVALAVAVRDWAGERNGRR